ncbi:MAG: H-type small acid-soluble spore protein [Alicyclobacillus herbarius]|uniref:H-type small acid-soluble spore protein n=1 Tax=Alicyclobacillus herbarius TaxID=122960 RepID=UPI000400C810|nr:H-type small acid-soluble spore protein [Alicyclobacillus herbarius]MCL6631505.1 H-type small acid-soluble spore protein [Alicyclobacillus herbarius]
MDVQRAKQILESPRIIPVTYRGKPVHIDEIYETNGYAKVHYENGEVYTAPVGDLREEQ